MKLILARHGNTFLPGEPSIWVGSRNNLPLVPSGIQQAEMLANNFEKKNIRPTAAYCGPLIRMKSYADILLTRLHLTIPLIVDERLNEIDYGGWSGLTTEQVCQQFGEEAYQNWEQLSVWPTNSDWAESAALVTSRIQQFTDYLLQQHGADETILVVASNGCLRYFLSLIPGEFQKRVQEKNIKIATGRACQFIFTAEGWQLENWNTSFAD